MVLAQRVDGDEEDIGPPISLFSEKEEAGKGSDREQETEENAKTDDFSRSVDTSLKTLGLDYVDLLLIHWPQPKVPLEETLELLGAAGFESSA